MKRFYEYKIVYDIDELTISVYKKEGLFVRNFIDGAKVYCELDNEKNTFFVYDGELNKVHISHHYADQYDKGYYEIIGSIEYNKGDGKKEKLKLQNMVKEQLKEVVKERLDQINSFINAYNKLMSIK